MTKKTTRAQRESLLRKYQQSPSGYRTYISFRRAAFWSFDTLMVHWCNMTLGIEPDGYTHS